MGCFDAICQICTIGFYLFEVFTVLLVGYTLYWYFARRPKNLPPGPKGIPLFGYFPFMGMNAGKTFAEIEKKYGPIMSFDNGSKLAVVINDLTLLKKAFQDDAFNGKLDVNGEIFFQLSESFLFHNGLKWKEGRRFSLSAVRDFGFGKATLEPRILEEISHFINEIKTNKKSKPFDPNELLGVSIGNILSLMLYGYRHEYNDQEVIEIRNLQLQTFLHPLQPLIFVFGPMFPYLVRSGLHRKTPGYNLVENYVKKSTDYVTRFIEEHKRNHYPGKKDDYIDAFLTEREERKKKNDHPELFDDATLIHEIRMLPLVGSDTIIFPLRWTLLFLMIHPDVQAKLHEEIDRVVGTHRQPSMSDKVNMPYTEAVLLEVVRKFSLTPLIDPHMALADTTFEGYFIPKGTLIYGNMWAIHHDEKYWSDPMSFRPERFIDENGKLIKTDRIINFGIGKRSCIGEGFAKMALFLYLVSVLQQFRLEPDESEHVSTSGSSSVIAVVAPPFKIRAIERNVK